MWTNKQIAVESAYTIFVCWLLKDLSEWSKCLALWVWCKHTFPYLSIFAFEFWYRDTVKHRGGFDQPTVIFTGKLMCKCAYARPNATHNWNCNFRSSNQCFIHLNQLNARCWGLLVIGRFVGFLLWRVAVLIAIHRETHTEREREKEGENCIKSICLSL